MASLFDKLNLRPNERRMVVIVLVIIFFVLNWMWVWPHFGDWKVQRDATQKARALITEATNEISQLRVYQQKLEALQGEAGVIEVDDRPDVKFSSKVQGLLRQAGIAARTVGPPTRSNKILESSFFEEYLVSVAIDKTSPEALKQFLLSLVNSDSLMRVQTLNLHLSGDKQGLNVSMTIVGSFQKPPPAADQPAAAKATVQTKR